MTEHGTDGTRPGQKAWQASMTLPAGMIAALVVAILALLAIGTRFVAHGDVNAVHALLSLFFSINLLVCYWEVCLFLRRDHLAERTEYWRRRRQETGRAPTRDFLASGVPLTGVLSPTVWADAYAAYAQYDGSYADRRTFGFMVDVGNGFVTAVPTLILYAAYTLDLVPSVVAGVIGVMLFWQWTYMTSLYCVSFFVAGQHSRISRGETWIYIYGINSLWVAFALLGLYVSVRLIVDGNFGVLGY